MNDSSCTFCKIVAGDIPAQVVGESELALAFKDIAPRQPLHILVIPKAHFKNVGELVAQDEAATLAVVQLGTQLAEKLSHGHYRFTFNTGEEAGQTVFHAHGHITSKSVKA